MRKIFITFVDVLLQPVVFGFLMWMIAKYICDFPSFERFLVAVTSMTAIASLRAYRAAEFASNEIQRELLKIRTRR